MPVLFENNAVGALSGSISGGATSFSLVGGQGALFPNPSNTFEYFYVRIGTDASNEVVKCTARATDTITCNATVGGWSSGAAVQLTLPKQVIALLPQLITADTTVTLRSSGGDYTTLTNLLAAIKNVIVAPGHTLTVEIDDGTWSAPVTIKDTDFLTPNRIIFSGRNTYSKTLSSIQSSSGSTGNWSLTLNLNNVTNIVVGDYAHIITASGGVNPVFVCGAHEITGVDGVNNRITVTSKNLYTSAPSGAVVGTITIIKSVLSFAGFSGFESNGGLGFASLKNMIVKGDGTASTYGLYAHDLGKLFADPVGTDFKIGVTGFPQAAYAMNGGLINARYACFVGIGAAQHVVIADNNSSIDIRNAVIIGGNYATYAYRRSFIDFTSGTACGNYTSGANTTHLYADKGGYITAVSHVTQPTGSVSPTANTVGNENSYIDT